MQHLNYEEIIIMNDEIKKTTSESISEADSGQAFDAALPQQEENDPTCDTCGVSMDYMPWHYSMGEERHLHACDQCWQTVGRAVQDDESYKTLSSNEKTEAQWRG